MSKLYSTYCTIHTGFHTMMRLERHLYCDLKNSKKYGSGLSCRWALFAASAFGFKMHLIFHRAEFKKPIKYSIWRIFIVGICAIRVLMRTRLNVKPNSPLKPTKVGFIFMSSRKSCSSQSRDTSCRQSWVEGQV